MLLIPLRDLRGIVVAHAKVDDIDADQAKYRWCLFAKGYAGRNAWVERKMRGFYLHREILGLVPGDGLQGDHRDGNRLDNRRSNLRVVTNAQNAQNQRARSGSTSEHRGVCWDSRKGKWRAYAEQGGRFHHLGRFDREEDAAAAASAFRAEHMPFSADARERWLDVMS